MLDIFDVAAEFRAVRWIPRVPVRSAVARRLSWLALAFLPVRSVRGVRVTTLAAPAAGIRVFVPETPRCSGALLWMHGGGLVVGRAAQDDRRCAATAREVGIVVVSVDYRLAPEHPWPIPLNDCLAAWRWLQEHARNIGIDSACIAIGGQSAGGELAAALAQRLVAEGGIAPVAQWLFSPMLDDRTAANRNLDDLRHFVWNNRDNRFAWRSYLGLEPGSESVPEYAVPARREDLTGLPPAWIGIGSVDLFCAEAQRYADRLRASGIDVILDVVPGAPHGFEYWGSHTATAREYVTRGHAWLARALECRFDPSS
jgi:acetyl esterase/lipase